MIRLRSSRAALLAPVASLAIMAALAACGGDGGSTNPGTNTPDTLDVFTPGNIFSPTTAEIRVGGTIRWRISEANDGTGHNVIFAGTAAGTPADIPVVKGVTVLRTFNRTGTFPYACTVHPGMNGDVIVR